MTSKAIQILIGIGLTAAYTAAVFHLSSSTGAAAVQKKWDLENERRDAVTLKIQAEKIELEKENAGLSQRINKKLEEHEKLHQINLAVARAEFAQRLRQSVARTGVYREQAQGSTAERERLASHAAELDRSLEEGRALVRELWETVEFRDQQLRQLGEQILVDRELLN